MVVEIKASKIRDNVNSLLKEIPDEDQNTRGGT